MPDHYRNREKMEVIPYASAIGSIMYAMLCIRPDVCLAISLAGRYQCNPGVDHWTAVKNILKYLKRTKDMFLVYGGDKELVVNGYVDASFDTDPDDSKSQAGYVFILNGRASLWDVTELNVCRSRRCRTFGTRIGRIVKTYDYINRVVITLPLSVYEDIALMKSFASELAAAGRLIDDDELKEYILACLDGEYNSVVASISAVPTTTLADVCAQLMAYDYRQQMLAESDQTVGADTSNPTHGRNPQRDGHGRGRVRGRIPSPRQDITCQICKKYGYQQVIVGRGILTMVMMMTLTRMTRMIQEWIQTGMGILWSGYKLNLLIHCKGTSDLQEQKKRGSQGGRRAGGRAAAGVGLHAAHRKLERHLAAVQHILLDAEAKSRTNPAVREWVSDLKTAAYQADDVLDNFRYEALRRRAQTRRSMPTTRKVLSYFTVDSPIVFRLSMSRRMKDVLEKIDELVVEMNNFHFLTHTETPSIEHPQTHSRVDESEIVSKLDEKEQVVKILLENQCDNNNVMKCELTKMEALQKELSQVLGKKRYLLVLDDVWNEDRQKWDDLRLLLCSDAGSGSAIIVTSRGNQVASVMGTIRSHQISLLNEDQSWELFHRNAFVGEVEKQDELILMARNIVQKCKGLPLAIKTIAALLRMEHHNEWFPVLDSDVWKNEILRTGCIPALQLSYDHLSPEAKICFSFCAIFPKGSMLDKDMVIHLWLTNDFIASETRGQQIFEVLVWRCFLQDVKTQENLLSVFRDEYIHGPTTCKMHDLMHDLAESVSGNDCTVLQKYSPNEIMQGSTHASLLLRDVRHLSLVSINNTRAAMKDIIAPRTIIFQREWFGTPLINRVKIHVLTSIEGLRYLDCSYSLIDALPKATSMLYSLQTLKLIGCENLKKLPEGMRCMSSLRHVFLIGCYYLKHMPKGIVKEICPRGNNKVIIYFLIS
uniref:Putative disease resistance protein RGA3 n=1 Tax=Aegilops tauschii TaxID=37682 RepID=M8D709_AEGTA